MTGLRPWGSGQADPIRCWNRAWHVDRRTKQVANDRGLRGGSRESQLIPFAKGHVMSAVVRNCCWACCAWAILGTSGFAVDIELIPVGGVGNEITVAPGDRVLVEVRISNWGDKLLRSVQAGLDPAFLTSASAGSISVFEPDVNGDGVCDPGSESYCTACNSLSAPATTTLEGIFVDDCRADHFSQIPPRIAGILGADLRYFRLYWSGMSDGVTDPGEQSFYVGTFAFQVSDDAQGTFALELAEDGWGMTFAMEPYPGYIILPTHLFGALIHVGDVAYGDVNRDELVDLFDILCVLDGISGGFPVCPFDAVNIEPCETDTTIDLYDLVGVLDAFMGSNRCNANR